MTYYIIVAGVDSTLQGLFTFTATQLPPSNDLCANAIAIPSLPPDIAYTTNAAAERTCTGTSGRAGDVWFSYTAPRTQMVDINLCTSSNFDTYLFLVSGASCDCYSCLASNDDACSPHSSRIQIILTAGMSYYIIVTGYGSETGLYSLSM